MSHTTNETRHLLIVGCGYVGERVARLAQQQGRVVHVLTRSTSRFAELQQLGTQPIQGHWLEPQSLQGLPEVAEVLVSVPHRVDESHPSATHVDGLKNLLAALPAGWHKLVYLSTTGVYGHSSDTLVTEQTPVSPTRAGPEMAVEAERWLAAHVDDFRFTVLRLAGIYGPGRVPLASALRQGEPLTAAHEGHLNLVHVSDIARMILTVFEQRLRQSLYLLSDGQPVLRADFYRHLAELCGVPEPEFVAPAADSPKARRATDKRIDPSRLVQETHFQFDYPTYRHGLAHALAAEE